MYEKLPEQLKKDGRFCLWKYEERNGRMTKVPYQTNGRKASSADKNTFSDFRLAVNAMDGYDGIGMGAFDDFCMVDIDHCVFKIKGRLGLWMRCTTIRRLYSARRFS